jgi:hypothetical protein
MARIKHSIFLLLFAGLVATILASCEKKIQYSKLEKYYKKNTAIHKSIFDSLIAFCKSYQTDVMLKKAPNNKIQFHILFENKATYIPVTYDSLFTRHDDYSLTLEYAIPLNIIKGFGKTIYWAASADSTGIFFSDKWRVKNQLGTQGDAQYGVFMSVDPISSDRCDKRLSDNVCLTISAIH